MKVNNIKFDLEMVQPRSSETKGDFVRLKGFNEHEDMDVEIELTYDELRSLLTKMQQLQPLKVK